MNSTDDSVSACSSLSSAHTRLSTRSALGLPAESSASFLLITQSASSAQLFSDALVGEVVPQGALVRECQVTKWMMWAQTVVLPSAAIGQEAPSTEGGHQASDPAAGREVSSAQYHNKSALGNEDATLPARTTTLLQASRKAAATSFTRMTKC